MIGLSGRFNWPLILGAFAVVGALAVAGYISYLFSPHAF